MKRTSNTMQRRVAPSVARHPDFQQFNTQLTRKDPPKGPRTSWWAEATSREDFRNAQREAQSRMSSTTETIKPADTNQD